MKAAHMELYDTSGNATGPFPSMESTEACETPLLVANKLEKFAKRLGLTVDRSMAGASSRSVYLFVSNPSSNSRQIKIRIADHASSKKDIDIDVHVDVPRKGSTNWKGALWILKSKP